MSSIQHKHPIKRGKVVISPDNPCPGSGKLAINYEGIVTIFKIVVALICVCIGSYLSYRGVVASAYSMEVQFGNTSLKFTDTPAGVALLILSLILLWRTRLDIKI
jgi:hypothetical protein